MEEIVRKSVTCWSSKYSLPFCCIEQFYLKELILIWGIHNKSSLGFFLFSFFLIQNKEQLSTTEVSHFTKKKIPQYLAKYTYYVLDSISPSFSTINLDLQNMEEMKFQTSKINLGKAEQDWKHPRTQSVRMGIG